MKCPLRVGPRTRSSLRCGILGNLLVSQVAEYIAQRKKPPRCPSPDDAEDLSGNRSLDAIPSRATDPCYPVGYKHIAEGAGCESNPSSLPPNKTKMAANPLHSREKI